MDLLFKILFKDFYHLLKSKSGRAFMRLVFRLGGKKRYRPFQTKFLDYEIQGTDALSFIWQVKEIFVDESYKFHTTKENPVICNCGANIGIDTLYFKKLYYKAQITAFEADPQIAAVFRKNIQQNEIINEKYYNYDPKTINLVEKAVWIDDQGIEIALEGADGASIFGEGTKIKIPSIRLKEWLAQQNEVDMLKMDIEGAETAVLVDCKDELYKVQNIFVEYHAYCGQPQTLDQILKILSDSGFRYYLQESTHRKSPLVNHYYKNNQLMDLQVNIFSYRN